MGESKEVSFLILRPEEINQVNKEEHVSNILDLPECFKCDGKKVNKKGTPCKKCNGTGRLNNKFFRDL
jgi:DnaJ-class molecular chaperone